jgi:hypothetical protein
MSSTAAHLVEKVLPALPYRQWVLSVPRRVRILLAIDHALLTAVLAMALKKIFAWQKRIARRLGIENSMCGAIGFVQRFGSLLNLGCHYHNILPDGVFEETSAGSVLFRPLPPPWREDIERLLEQIARGTEKLIARRAELESGDGAPGALEQAQAKSLRIEPDHSARSKGSSRKSKRQAFCFGYSLHAERIVHSDDRVGLERLCRYASRAPIAKSRLSLAEDGQVVLRLMRPLQDGRTQLRFGEIEFLHKLAILIPPPQKNLTRYFGVFAPNHHCRESVVGIGREDELPAQPAEDRPHPRALPWAELLRRVFAIDILKCDQCGGDMKIIAVIIELLKGPKVDFELDRRALTRPHTSQEFATLLIGSSERKLLTGRSAGSKERNPIERQGSARCRRRATEFYWKQLCGHWFPQEPRLGAWGDQASLFSLGLPDWLSVVEPKKQLGECFEGAAASVQAVIRGGVEVDFTSRSHEHLNMVVMGSRNWNEDPKVGLPTLSG